MPFLAIISASETSPNATLLVWLPVPVLLLAIAVLWLVDPGYSYHAPHLLLVLNFYLSTTSSLLALHLAARSLC